MTPTASSSDPSAPDLPAISAALACAPTPSVILDADDVIRSASPALERALGRDLRRRPARSLWSTPSEGERLRAGFEGLRRRPGSTRVDVTVLACARDCVPARVHARALPGAPERVLLAFRPVAYADVLAACRSGCPPRACAPGSACAQLLEVAPLLSPREREVLEWSARGVPPAKIAEALSIRPNTLRNHARAVYRKLGVTCRRELYALLWRISESSHAALLPGPGCAGAPGPLPEPDGR